MSDYEGLAESPRNMHSLISIPVEDQIKEEKSLEDEGELETRDLVGLPRSLDEFDVVIPRSREQSISFKPQRAGAIHNSMALSTANLNPLAQSMDLKGARVSAQDTSFDMDIQVGKERAKKMRNSTALNRSTYTRNTNAFSVI